MRAVSRWELLWVYRSLGHVGLLLSRPVLAGVGVGLLTVLSRSGATGRSLDRLRAVPRG